MVQFITTPSVLLSCQTYPIMPNVEKKVFSRANLSFSVGGKYFLGEPISYDYMEDRIFEYSRNITIKLHHRVGRFVKLTLGFAAKWILISEITFESDVAHGNFSLETMEESVSNANSRTRDTMVEKTHPTLHHHHPDQTISTAHHEDQTYMAVIIVFLTSIIILLAIVMFFTISRHRQRKCFASPLSTKTVLAPHHMGTTSGSSCGSYGAKDISAVPLDDPLIMDQLAKLDDYQEPYQALKYAPYYSYSTVVMETLGKHPTTALQSDTSYDYAIPTVPLLGATNDPPPPVPPSLDSFTSKGSIPSSKGSGSRDDNKGKRSPNHQDMLGALKKRLEQTMVPEFPRHRLRMLSKIGEGSFGTLYVAEADGIPEYGMNISLGKRLVAVKFLTRSAGEKERLDFIREVRILAALEDANIARVLGMCSEEPICAVLEYLQHGDLNTFLKNHQTLSSSHSNITSSLSFNCLLYMATQIASGMRYLESLNFVHRDLATRNCLVGKKFEIKISDFATDSDMFSSDYYRVHDNTSLPIRWMAWESVRLRKFTTKSDVWSFGVTLWEILNLARHRPYEGLTDLEVLENISHLHADDGEFIYLPTPQTTKDILDLMNECWKRSPTERPSFTEIHLFLQRKNLGYVPPMNS
ncbi:hypothetical protein M8J75_012818 [Diaphorina citri]|nr:hypothetical protein M8J75_012818 [Diaphorina citri]